jgi:hypothetical protein
VTSSHPLDTADPNRPVGCSAIAGLPEISISIFAGGPIELPNAPFYRRWSFILASVIGLAAITALGGAGRPRT